MGAGFKKPDPDLGYPKRPDPTESGTRSRSNLNMFLMLSKINNFLGHFYTFKHLMTLKIKDKQIILKLRVGGHSPLSLFLGGCDAKGDDFLGLLQYKEKRK